MSEHSNDFSYSNSIISNDDCIPDEDEINRQLELFKQSQNCDSNHIQSKVILFDLHKIAQSNPAIMSLINSQFSNPNIDLIGSITTLIKQIPEYAKVEEEEVKKEVAKFKIEKEREREDTFPLLEKQIKTTAHNELSQIAEENIDIQKQSVYDRLYDKRKKFEIQITEQKSPIHNMTLSKEKESYLNKLYNDSKKQKQKQVQMIKTITVKTNDKSNLILYNKFIQQFTNCLNQLFSKGDLKSKEWLELNELKLLMNYDNLGFLSVNNSPLEENLFNKLFDLLKNKDCIWTQNAFVFFISILNLYNCFDNNSSSVCSTTTSSYPKTSKMHNKTIRPSFYFSINDNQIDISKQQSLKIAKDFQILSNNWKQNLIQKNKKSISNQISNNNFKPITNIKYNSKIKGNLFTHIKQYKNLHISKEKMQYKIKEERENKELLNCTFTPKLTSSSSKSKYKLVNYSKSTIRSSKSKDEIEFESNRREYTFKPKVNHVKNKSLDKMFNDSLNSFTSMEEKAYLDRMKNSRIERERINNLKKLRIYSQNKQKSEKKKPNSISLYPFNDPNKYKNCVLIIDITIKSVLHRIFVYKGDKKEEVFNTFITKNNIEDKVTQLKIQNIINKEMSSL